jgi:hypothetical protein
MRLRQGTLLNLLSNANKFTEGTVIIAARQGQEKDREWITLSVADTGIGMTAEQMGKLFRPDQSWPASSPVCFAAPERQGRSRNCNYALGDRPSTGRGNGRPAVS